MEFSKIVGAGNDFVIMDNRDNKIYKKKTFAKKICNRKFGVGADGLILLENSKRADFKMRIFNPDGSEAEMCGNGLRCLVRFIKEENILKTKEIKIETKAGIYYTQIDEDKIKIKMNIIGKPKMDIKISVKGENYTCYYLNTGVPHTVIFVKNIEKVKVEEIGPEIRYSEIFKPKGTNVDWVEVINQKSIRIRTYERGVEGETLACGTGIVAGAIISFLTGKISPPVNVIPASGEILKVYFSSDLKEIFLEGKTNYIFKGIIVNPQ